MSFKIFLFFFFLFPVFELQADSFRTIVEGSIEITPENLSGSTFTLGINSSVLITLGAEQRFLRGVELEINAPQTWIPYRGSLVMAIYNRINPKTASGIADFSGNRVAQEPLPGRIQIVYHIPVRPAHGLRTTRFVTVPTEVTALDTFPVLFRLMPAIKGFTDEFEAMTFSITARPILNDEGAVRLIPRFPPQLRNRPFTVLINDVVIDNISEQIILREGENHLVVLSEDYRNQSHRFVVERARVLDLIIDLQDPTPLIIFEAPQNAQIFLNNTPVLLSREPIPVEPGQHEARFQIGDYTVIRTLNIQRGKTYRVALDVDVTILEEE
jgi:hypothetical protein